MSFWKIKEVETIGKLTCRGFSQQSGIESSSAGRVGSRSEVCQGLLFSLMIDIDLNETKRNLLPPLFYFIFIQTRRVVIGWRLRAVWSRLKDLGIRDG